MQPLATYIHSIDPIIVSVAGVHLWWYGLSYSLGFLNLFLWLRRRRAQLDFTPRMVYELTIMLSAGVLIGGRGIEVGFYEWPFYRQHLYLIPAYWLGGMATHGLLLGGLAGAWLFCRMHRRPFWTILDALCVPGAFILGVGRLGNFIDGQIVGSVTDVWWGVKFPDAEDFRHPVVLYDGLKNLALIPVLIYLSGRASRPGTVAGAFFFLYAFLRIPVDVFREYPTTLLGLATGQSLNIAMSLAGVCLLLWSLWNGPRPLPRPAEQTTATAVPVGPARKAALGFLIVFSLAIPSDWTQDVPARYGRRHAGLAHSLLYPALASEFR